MVPARHCTSLPKAEQTSNDKHKDIQGHQRLLKERKHVPQTSERFSNRKKIQAMIKHAEYFRKNQKISVHSRTWQCSAMQCRASFANLSDVCFYRFKNKNR